MAQKGTVRKDEIAKIETTELAELDTSGSSAREVAEIQAAYVMAMRFPRDEEKAEEKIIKAAERMAVSSPDKPLAYYAYPRGGSLVSGPSINFAVDAARCWRNIRYGFKIIRDDEEFRTILGWALDLETNDYSESPDHFQKLIYRKDGGWIKPDERDLRELTNRRGAIATRNALLRLFPRDIVDRAIKAAMLAVEKAARKDKPGQTQLIMETFARFGVTKEQLEKHLGHALEKITEKEIAELRGIAAAIKDGEVKKEEVFNGQNAPATGTLKMGDLQAGKEKDHQGHDALPQEKQSDPVADLLADIASMSTRAGIEEFNRQLNKRLAKAGIKGDDILKITTALNARKKDIEKIQKEGV